MQARKRYFDSHRITIDRINTGEIWRERVEVESTTRSAKERVAGFEGREGHRTPFAPATIIPLNCRLYWIAV